MASTIKLKRGSGVPTSGTLAAGEPALDLTNNELYTSTDGTDVVKIGVNNLVIETADDGKISIGDTDITAAATGCIAIGNDALSQTTGAASFGNLGIGYEAGKGITTGDTNICIGESSGGGYLLGGGGTAPSLGTGFNNICIGWKSAPSANNVMDEITLGNGSTSNLRCNDTSISSLSDARDKIDIVDSPYGAEWLKGVKVRKYKWASRDGNSKDGLTRIGFIAQELQEACGECNSILNIIQESNPEKLEIKMGNLVPILTKAVQELTARIEALESN